MMREQYDDDINSFNYWPRRLPDRTVASVALTLLSLGVSQSEVRRRTGLTSNRVLGMHRAQSKYDPIDDDVAIERALKGDGTVIPNLTFYERSVVLNTLVDRYEASEEGWLPGLLADWGMTPERAEMFQRRVAEMALHDRVVGCGV